jgi:hypothetical protein
VNDGLYRQNITSIQPWTICIEKILVQYVDTEFPVSSFAYIGADRRSYAVTSRLFLTKWRARPLQEEGTECPGVMHKKQTRDEDNTETELRDSKSFSFLKKGRLLV